ncbi:MAG: nitroreductase family protein [Candidatus Kapaibacteriales bacterium]
MDKNSLLELGSLNKIFSERWSPRSFSSEKSISEKDLETVFQAARISPSCYNEQPWRYIVCNGSTDKEAWEKLFSVINEWNQGWCKNCPVLVLVLSRNSFEKNKKENAWSEYDTGAATMSAVLQASILGIDSHQMGGFDKDKSLSIFGIESKEFTPISVLALGYKSEPSEVSEKYKESEVTPRERKKLEDIVYWGSFK